MHCFRHMSLVLALLGGLLCSLAGHAEPLHWTVWPIPGVVNVVDNRPSDGMTMLAIRQLMRRLPELEADYRLANRLRQQRDMERGEEICSTPLFQRTDTDAYAYFVPFLVSTPIQAVIRQDRLDEFPLTDGRLQLQALLPETPHRAAVSAVRTYPPLLRDWLTTAEQAGRAQRISGSLSGENLLLMVSYGRIDLTFEFATITQAISNQLHTPQPLVSVPLAEEMDLVISGIYCTGTPWGRAMAEQLDQAIRDLLKDPQAYAELISLYADYLPAETWAAFQNQVIAYYAERAEQVTRWPDKARPAPAGSDSGLPTPD